MAWYRCTGGNGGGGGATKVPYVYSTAQQYVALPLYDDDDFIIEAKIAIKLKNIQAPLIGDGQWSSQSFVLYNENNETLQLRYNTSGNVTIQTEETIINNFVDIEMDSVNGTIVYNGTTYGGTPVRNHWQVGLFAQNASNRLGYLAIDEMKIYKDDALYMDLVPMKNESTNAGYLHDTVGEQDYYSLTSTNLKYDEIWIEDQ